MASYTHFGKQADVFKHLIFCEVLQNEKPSVYVETNSASAIYRMEHTPEQHTVFITFWKMQIEKKY